MFDGVEDEDTAGEAVYMKEELIAKVEAIQEGFRRRLGIAKGKKTPWNEHLSLVSDKKIEIIESAEVSADI